MKKLIVTVAAGLVAIGGVVAIAVMGAGAGAATGHARQPPPPRRRPWPRRYKATDRTRVLLRGHGPRWGRNGEARGRRRLLDDKPVPAGRRRRVPHVRASTSPPAGNDLTNVTVKSAYVKVPGLKPIPLVYSTHPTKPAVSYWTAAWPVAKAYPLGVVNYSVTVVTNPVPAGLTAAVPSEKGVFMQQDSPQVASMLTIEPSS